MSEQNTDAKKNSNTDANNEQQESRKSATSTGTNPSNNCNLLPGSGGGCWKSTPGANGQQPPRLSLSAIIPLSAVCNANPKQNQQQKQKKRSSSNISDRTMLPGGGGANGQSPEPKSRLRRFFAISSVRRSLAIDAASLLIFVPLAISTSLALMRLFVGKVGSDQLEWHHYLLVAALASLILVPVCRLAYSCHQYRRRLRRMALADLHSPGEARGPHLTLPVSAAAAAATAAAGSSKRGKKHDYTTKSKQIEAANAARALEYREFACLVAKQHRIELSRRDVSAVEGGGGDLSCHRPDISMAAYNC